MCIRASNMRRRMINPLLLENIYTASHVILLTKMISDTSDASGPIS
uniref:Uncharacterized protein n=1 Tax=Arundo donax TaxID=35708 RepID=A0A0A9GCJ7_ARUDO